MRPLLHSVQETGYPRSTPFSRLTKTSVTRSSGQGSGQDDGSGCDAQYGRKDLPVSATPSEMTTLSQVQNIIDIDAKN